MKRFAAGQAGRGLAIAGLLMSLLVPLLPASAAAKSEPERVHPALAKMASEDPNQSVRVIVQGYQPGVDLGTEVMAKGGKNGKALSLIKGYAAEMPAAKALELAKNSDVKWVSIDAPMVSTAQPTSGPSTARSTGGSSTAKSTSGSSAARKSSGISAADLATVYPLAVEADKVWNGSAQVTGAGVTVAVLDSGIAGAVGSIAQANKSLESMLKAGVNFDTYTTSLNRDGYGHGTHVAGIIANSGTDSQGKYIRNRPGRRAGQRQGL